MNESVLPKGEATDLGCSINIMESAVNIIEMPENEAVAYLINKGWQEIECDYSQYIRLFICQDSSLVIECGINLVPGPRSTLTIIPKDGKIKGTKVDALWYPEEDPFHHLAVWDAWVHRTLGKYDYWSASMQIGDDLHRYSAFIEGEHELFYKELSETREKDIYMLNFQYTDKLSIGVTADRFGNMARIVLDVGLYEKKQ